jgi:hypothetical protein
MFEEGGLGVAGAPFFEGNFKSNPRFFKNNPKKKIAPAIGLATAPPYIF